MFLTYDQLVELTGYRRKSDQRRWLLKNGYRFDVAHNGMAKVLHRQVEQRQAIRDLEQTKTEPNFKALLGK